MVAKRNIEVENTWEMLRYLYDELRSRKFKNFDCTKFSNVDDLYASIICQWSAAIAHEGLYKEYVTLEDEELNSPKGQIKVAESISMNTRSRGTLICSYDELSGDIYLNHILKGAIQDIINNSNVSNEIKVEAKKTMMLFNGVRYVALNDVKWKDIKYNNNTIRYKNLIEVIKHNAIESKLQRQGLLDNNSRAFILFKRQLFKWVKVRYGKVDYIEAITRPFILEDEEIFELKLNKVQKFIIIRSESKALMLCVRMQNKQLLDDPTLGRQHMEELVEAIREYVKDHKVKVSGCLVYVNTDKTKINLQPITMNVVKDYTIGEQVVDIHDQWRFVTNKIEECYKLFIERAKQLDKGAVSDIIEEDDEDKDE